MELRDLIKELSQRQAELINQYISLMQEKEDFLKRFEEIEPTLQRLANQNSSFNEFADAITDIASRLNNYDLNQEMIRFTKYTSALLKGLAKENQQ